MESRSVSESESKWEIKKKNKLWLGKFDYQLRSRVNNIRRSSDNYISVINKFNNVNSNNRSRESLKTLNKFS